VRQLLESDLSELDLLLDPGNHLIKDRMEALRRPKAEHAFGLARVGDRVVANLIALTQNVNGS
jgi:hypothetical protein